ncbi:MAG: LTA synthase family protein [Lachnospiraceae bacterium]|jgi:phosphoglycerol transferase MdoB-like AlkP superfamily enzyme
MKEQKQIKRSIIAYNVICYILLVCGSVCFHALYKKRIAVFLAIVFGSFYAVQMLLLRLDERHLKRLKYVLVGSCLFVSAAFSVIVVELISGNLFIGIQYFIGNFLIYSVIYFVLLFVTRRLITSTVIGMLLLFAFTVANYYVTQFRGNPIAPSDFLSIRTAASVMNTYHYEITWEMYSSFILILWWATVVKTVGYRTGRMSRREVLHWTLPVTLIVATIIGTEFFLPNLDLWDLKNNIKKYGVAMSLVSNTRKMYIKEPEGYSYKNLESWYDEYKQHEESSQQKIPNIIAVMNESFADLTVLEPFMDSNIYMPYYNTLTNNTIKGTVLVSTVGGGTANTEYEFLTRNSMAFFPGMIPYQQFIKGEADSLADDLKQKGYRAVALHPYGRYGYNRDKVYPALGFDEFLDVTSFENPELERDWCVTDEESYKKIIEIFEATDEPLFVFNVTMQNHGGYETGFFGENVISIPGMEGEFPDVEEYLTLIKKSDEAFRILIDYFSQVKEPTIIVMFGDHQPKISEKFYDKVMGKSSEELSLEEMQKKYEVPFFIWANYDIPEQENVYTSMNYLSGLVLQTAEMEMTPYQKFLLDLRETIPAMNMMGYLGDDGEWHYYYEENQYRELLDKYWHIQYNNVFAKRKSKEWFEE